MSNDKFYDIHCHAMDLSHPNLSAFIQRVFMNRSGRRAVVAIAIVAALLAVSIVLCALGILPCLVGVPVSVGIVIAGGYLLVWPTVRKAFNLLAVMENDVGNLFLLVEECLKRPPDGGVRVLDDDQKLRIEETRFDKIVLTPLVMDFGAKRMDNPWFFKRLFYYRKPIQKPVVAQVTDLFNGIRRYVDSDAREGKAIFEIYPFLGLNTRHYTCTEIERMLEKYFSRYTGQREDLFRNLGKFTGDIDSMDSNYFAGIKVYPPLGFDPWPDDAEQQKRVECLYRYCCEKRIPLTTHCSEGGFKVISDADVRRYACPEKWVQVLSKYGTLKLNLAHMGSLEHPKGHRLEGAWVDTVFQLIAEYENVYTDFSGRAYDASFYKELQEVIEGESTKLERILAGRNYRLEDRIMFGTDFMVNLLWIDSYNEYLKYFAEDSYISKWKLRFCHENPERFLFVQAS